MGDGFASIPIFVDAESTPGVAFGVLSFCSAVWLFATMIHPPKFLKPRWIRELDRAIKDGAPSAVEYRVAVLHEIRQKIR